MLKKYKNYLNDYSNPAFRGIYELQLQQSMGRPEQYQNLIVFHSIGSTIQKCIIKLQNMKTELKSDLKSVPEKTHQITPCLWFDNQAEEAASFYVSIFKDSKILKKSYYTKEGTDIHGQKSGSVMTVEFQINGQSFTALNGGPIFKFTEGISFQVFCDSQEEIDYYWSKLTKEGQEVRCGWMKDKYGLSWQIVPSILSKLMTDPSRAERVTKVLLSMVKLDIGKLTMA
jgi:predicted 3-demethylubiquinone-9 3-methyltransferase (glyoxalase superfamily)